MTLAEVYRGRWRVENALQELGQALDSEMATLCYPKAALLTLCVALFTANVLNTIKAALHAVQDAKPEAASTKEHRPFEAEPMSSYYLAEEIAATYGGMLIAVPPPEWTSWFGAHTPSQLADALMTMAKSVPRDRFRKARRGPKKKPPQRTGGYPHKHISTGRLLQTRQTATANS